MMGTDGEMGPAIALLKRVNYNQGKQEEGE